jgi:hypothetical protein
MRKTFSDVATQRPKEQILMTCLLAGGTEKRPLY